MNEQNQSTYEFGPFRLEAQKRLLWRDGEIVPLKPKAFDTLLALVEGSGRLVGKDELMNRVWPDTVVEDGNLTFNISTLRKALGDDPRLHQYIVTIPGEGYRFVAGVRAGFDELEVRERTRVTIEKEDIVSELEARQTERPSLGTDENLSLRTASAASTGDLAPRQSSLVVHHPRAGRRASALVVVPAVLVAAAMIFGAYHFFIRQHQSSNSKAAAFREITLTRLTNSGKVTLAAISPDGRYVVHVLAEGEGQSLWVRQVAVTAAGKQIVPPAQVRYGGLTFSPDGNYVYCVVFKANQTDAELLQVPVLGGPARKLPVNANGPVSFSPDGKQLALVHTGTANGQTFLRIAGSDGGNMRTLATRRQPDFYRVNETGPAWSPDGEMIACGVTSSDAHGNYESVVGVRVLDGAERSLTSQRWSSVRYMAWVADGSGLIITAKDKPSSPRQVWHLSFPGGEARQITNDLNYYTGVSLTAGYGQMVTVQNNQVVSIWVMPAEGMDERRTSEGNASGATKIASEVGWLEEIAWTPDRKIVYRSHASGDANIWIMEADGTGAKQLTLDTHQHRGLSVSGDGRYVVFSSNRTGNFNIWRMNIDGSELKQLTEGSDETFPQCSPDNRWVIYQQGYGQVTPTLRRIPIGGGEATPLTNVAAQKPAVSPNGKLIAYYYMDNSQWHIGVVPFAGGPPVKSFDLPATVYSRVVRWTPDGRALAYIDSPGGVSNILAQPLEGGLPRQLTDFKEDSILAFDWSRDGRRLALVRGAETSDVVFIESSQK